MNKIERRCLVAGSMITALFMLGKNEMFVLPDARIIPWGILYFAMIASSGLQNLSWFFEVLDKKPGEFGKRDRQIFGAKKGLIDGLTFASTLLLPPIAFGYGTARLLYALASDRIKVK